MSTSFNCAVVFGVQLEGTIPGLMDAYYAIAPYGIPSILEDCYNGKWTIFGDILEYGEGIEWSEKDPKEFSIDDLSSVWKKYLEDFKYCFPEFFHLIENRTPKLITFVQIL